MEAVEWTSLNRAGTRKETPALEGPRGWARSPVEKANLLSETLSKKSVLPDPVLNHYSVLTVHDANKQLYLPIPRVRNVANILRQLSDSSSTGPDGIPAKFLERFSHIVSLPICILTRILLSSGEWPTQWKTHWIHCLFKRGAHSNPSNYRGVHLTSQLSKVVERVISSLLVPFLERHQRFSQHQFAYRRNVGFRDVLLINICHWLVAFESRKGILLYCSDVSGAFDKVPTARLIRKLFLAGILPKLLKLLCSWLQGRQSCVNVKGKQSVFRELRDQVFQGTVLGPPLWNLFFADVGLPVRTCNFRYTAFADDMNAWLPVDPGTVDPLTLGNTQLQQLQSEVHQYG